MKTIFLISGSLLAVLFVMLGIAIGVSYDASTEETLAWIQALSSVGGVVIAVSTMLIALYALRTWKSQFDHAEKFKAIVNLETQLRALYESFDSFLEGYIQNVVYANSEKDYSDLQKCYLDERDSFIRLMNFSLSFLSSKEQNKVLQEFEKTLKVFDDARGLANSYHGCGDTSDFNILRFENNKEIERNQTDYKGLLRRLRR
ncbi:hypothetical protein L2719_08645 [Shewanella schlegeliana]|uniref:DUF4760 domain-containing protein n=1 Tax=Shewanella schlegeliana TaxID=190308 RepID=A0ABS1T1B4_9GAMM|nr:hypothetical protein [Shewanella schlegeliana]MBL4914577.1 hypothetical protein [Shewanella schlegeliana]MCL1109607.1 hypothetical protein [Shewanella schlegeliana]